MKSLQITERQFISMSRLNWFEVYEASLTMNFDVCIVLIGECLHDVHNKRDSLYVNVDDTHPDFADIRDYLLSTSL